VSEEDDTLDGSPPAMPPARRNNRSRRPAGDVAFDMWLERGLHAMYDDIAKEPVPPELLALIERDRESE